MSENWLQTEVCIVINDKWQCSTAKHLSCELTLLQIYHSINFTIGEHLVKLQAKWMIVSYTPCAIDLCPQCCRTRQISKITCVWWTETVTLMGRLMWVYYQQISNCCRPVLIWWLADICHQRLTDCWSCTAFCCNIFFLCYGSCVQSVMGFYTADVDIFSVN